MVDKVTGRTASNLLLPISSAFDMGREVIGESGGNADGLIVVREGYIEASHDDMRFSGSLGYRVGLGCKS